MKNAAILLFVFLIFIFLPLVAIDYPTPYAGSSRPATKSELQNGLAGKADTTVVKELEERFEADSAAKADSLAALRVADSLLQAQLAVLEDTKYFFRIAGDTTSPGMFYTLKPDGLWYRADTSISTKALGVAVDSVAKGATCRFLRSGTFALSLWQGLWPPGTLLVSDSTIAGKISITDPNRSNAKKMQKYATAADSATGEIIINIDPNVWTWEAQ